MMRSTPWILRADTRMHSQFTQSQVTAIAEALGDASEGLTHAEIDHILALCRMEDPSPDLSKRLRLHNAFAQSQNALKNRTAILAFIRHAMKPERYINKKERFETLRARLNRALAFAGIEMDEAGELFNSEKVTTLPEAERRAQELRADLSVRSVHPDVLQFCRAELVSDNYFHAVLEATKSIADKIRVRTGLTYDGTVLIDRAFGGDTPMLAINSLQTESEKSEQRGFVNLVKGVFGMFRNVTAHEARIHWSMGKADAEDLLSLASLIHRRIDAAHRPVRV